MIQPHLNVGRGASASSRRECTGRSRRKTILPVEPRIIVFCDAQSLGGFLSQDLEKIGNSRAQAMVEEMQPYPVEVRHVPGAKMELLDHGSCNPISYGQHKLFDTEVGSLGACVRSNRVIPMESTDIKDPKVETLAAMAVRDDATMRDVDHVRNHSQLENVEKASELGRLEGVECDLT